MKWKVHISRLAKLFCLIQLICMYYVHMKEKSKKTIRKRNRVSVEHYIFISTMIAQNILAMEVDVHINEYKRLSERLCSNFGSILM